jgi:caffeoyl-CoA O-methyltransferase
VSGLILRMLRNCRLVLPRGPMILIVLIGAGFLAATSASMEAFARSPEADESKAQRRLAWMREHQKGMWNVSAGEGAFLRDQVIKVRTRSALEIGTSNGYSGIWISLGLRKTGGHLLTLEIDQDRSKLAEENFRVAGVDSLVSLRQADALEEIPKLKGPFDFVFIDAEKHDYLRYLRMVEPRITPGGVIMAHNVTDLPMLMEDFIQAVKIDPQLKTTFENPGPGGFSVSIKIRSR